MACTHFTLQQNHTTRPSIIVRIIINIIIIIMATTTTTTTTALSGDYLQRAKTYQFATKGTIQQTLDECPKTIILDVRTNSEIESSGMWNVVKPNSSSSTTTTNTTCTFYNVPCTPTDATDIANQSSTLFPNKDVPIIIYCGSGRRASTAQQVLKGLGYQTVLNAGGYTDLVAMGLIWRIVDYHSSPSLPSPPSMGSGGW